MSVLGIAYIGLRTPDVEGLHRFYADLTGADRIEGTHGQLRLGGTVLGFWHAEAAAVGPDVIGLEVDAAGFEAALGRARGMGLVVDGPRRYNPHSRGFEVLDPEGRTLEFLHNDPAVFWTSE